MIPQFYKNSIVIILLCFCTSVQAQLKRVQNNPNYDKDVLQLGFTLGYNNMFFRLKPSADLLFNAKSDSVWGVEPISQAGFCLGMVSELKLFKYLSLRVLPGMSFGQRNLLYKQRNLIDFPDSVVFKPYTMQVSTIDVEVPVLLKLMGMRINNYRPYLISGGNVRYDLETRRKNQKNEGYAIKIKPLDFFFEIGAGISFYLTYFKLSTELKMSYGIRDILVHEPNIDYNSVIDKLQTKMFLLSFHFE